MVPIISQFSHDILVIILSWPGTSHWIIIYATEPLRPAWHSTASQLGGDAANQTRPCQLRKWLQKFCLVRSGIWSYFIRWFTASPLPTPGLVGKLWPGVLTSDVDTQCWHLAVDIYLFVCLRCTRIHHASCRLVFTRIINFLIVHYCRGNRGNEVGVARKLPSLLLTLQGLMSGVAVTLPHISLNVISCQLGSQLSHTLQ